MKHRTLYLFSHWQGASKFEPLGTIPDELAPDELVARLTTCSFCAPGRSTNYSTGVCYNWKHTRKDYGPLDDELLDRAGLKTENLLWT